MFRDLVKLNEVECQVDDLILFKESASQTEVSFGTGLYKRFIKDQSELHRVYNKMHFSDELVRMIGQKEEITFLRDKEMHDSILANLYDMDKIDKNLPANKAQGIILGLRTPLFPELKVREILSNYSFEAKKAIDARYEVNELNKNMSLYKEACQKFKTILKELDESYTL